ncbi:hypothetical protein PUMCH_000253 [Australozyma saopauloensis]|uniref:Topoisomerase 1-associated factor 1 n=1 Tax=Australozyma saopauloensis TaxID=291208 RepID=A0AAX4H398_9ASCO|nr:hypothetical protein PUMCH_000253 [[Candida] saopauloensis]
MSDPDNYAEDEELADFVVEDAPVLENTHDQPDASSEDEAQVVDRLAELTSTQRTNETPTSRILKAHIAILVSALGGPDHTSEQGLYKLGHDALACLKDLKRWIKSVDERNSTSDVALACAECGLFQNDLTVILCQWDKPQAGVVRTRTTNKIMIACLELLVLLTWPTELNKKISLEEYSSRAKTRLAQLRYKHHILKYNNGKTLKAAIRLGLNALKLTPEERDPRDLSILRLIVYFIRNILFIQPLPAVNGAKAVSNFLSYPSGIQAEDLSIFAILPVFEQNNVLMFLTSIAHSVLNSIQDEQFGLLAVECLYLLTKEVRVDTLYLKVIDQQSQQDTTKVVPPASAADGLDLSALLSEEDKRKKKLRSAMSSRHGRFGTLLSLQNSSNASYLAVSGQKALASTYDTLQSLDSTKKWHKTSTFKYDSNSFVTSVGINLYGKVLRLFLTFIDHLLTSGSINNLLLFVSRHFTNLANDDMKRTGLFHVIDSHELASYFLLISWLFEFKRNKASKLTNESLSPDEDNLDYGSVGAALSEVNFILLTAYVRSSFEARDYNSLHVAMICFREMLLIANSIFARQRTQKEIELLSEEDINEDRELAEGIIRKLFSQKEFLDLCVNIPKTAYKHSPEYLNVSVSLVHILLKSFETLANEDVHLFIKARRRMRKLQNGSGLNHQMDREHWHLIDRGSDEEDDEEEIKYITRERKLDFKNAEVRFFHPEIVRTHISFLERYEDLSHEDIKRGISYFHRLFVMRKDYSALYRLDFVVLLYKLQAYLPRSSGIRRHVDEFVIYFMKKFQDAISAFPTAIELLFPRFDNLEYKAFLSTGDLEVFDSKNNGQGSKTNSYFDSDAIQPRAAIVYEFVENEKSLSEKLGALTYHIMKKKNTTKLLTLLSEEFMRIHEAAKRGARSELFVRLNLANRRLVVSEPLVRLLLLTVGFDLPFLQNDETVFRIDSNIEVLKEGADLLKYWLAQHQRGAGDIEPFLDQFQRVIFSGEEIAFGKKALELERGGIAIDPSDPIVQAVGMPRASILVGLARRREYDEQVSAKFYPEDLAHSLSDLSDGEFVESHTSRRTKRNTTRDEFENGLDSADDEPAKKRRRKSKKSGTRNERTKEDEAPPKPVISAELVADSDDDSDSEENRQFFEQEERLRELIAAKGGIANKDELIAFQQSWSKLITPLATVNVIKAVTSASRLFVSDLDDEDDAIHESPEEISLKVLLLNSVPLEGTKLSFEGSDRTVRRKRVIEDDEDDED